MKRTIFRKAGAILTSAALLAGTFSQAVFAAPSYTFQENTTEGLVPVKEVLFEEGFENAVSVNEGSLWGTAQKNLSVLKNETSAAVGNGFLTVTGKANAKQSLILKSTAAIKGKFAVEFKFKIAGEAAVPLLFGAGNSTAEENRAVEIGIDGFINTPSLQRNLTYTKSDKTQNPLVDITSPWRTKMDFNKWFLLHGDGNSWATYSRDWYTLKTVIDTNGKTYSVFLNGSLCVKDEPFADTSTDWAGTGIDLPFMMTTQDSGAIKYDDIKIYREPDGRTTYYANDFNNYPTEEEWKGATSYNPPRYSLFAGVAGLGLANTQSKGGKIYARNNALVTEYRGGSGGAFAGFIRMDKNMTIDTDITVKSFEDDSYQDNYATVLTLTSTGADGIRFAVSKDGKFIYHYYNRTIPYMPTILSNITLDEPHRITLYMDFETYTCDLYIDGKLVANKQNLLYTMGEKGKSLYLKDGEDMTIGLGYHKESPTTDITYDNLRIYKDIREEVFSAAAKELKGMFSGTYKPKGEIALPSSVSGIDGYGIRWVSDSDVVKIASDGFTATVVPRAEETVVNLTAAVSDANKECTLTKTFPITIAADDTITDISSLTDWVVVKGAPLLSENPTNEADKTVQIAENSEAYSTLNCSGSEEEISAELYMDKKASGSVYLADKDGNILSEIGLDRLYALKSEKDGNNTIKSLSYPHKKWFVLSFKTDMLKRCFDVYINTNKLNNAPIPFDFSQGSGDIARIGFKADNGSMFVNDITEKAVSESEGIEICKIIYNDANGKQKNAPSAGGSVAAVEVSSTKNTQNAVLFAAAYDENKNMVSADKKIIASLSKGKTRVSLENVKIPENWNESCKVKAFLWSDVQKITPLTDTHGENLLPTIYIAGDSTAADYKAEQYPYAGWGTALENVFNGDKVKITNMAQADCTADNFVSNGTLEALKTRILPGDYLFIAFSYDDAVKNTSETAFKNNLKTIAAAAKENGANVVFVTSPAPQYTDISPYVGYTEAVSAELGAKCLNLNSSWNGFLQETDNDATYYGKETDTYAKSDLRWTLSALNPESENYDAALINKDGRLSGLGADMAAALISGLVKNSGLPVSAFAADNNDFTYTVSGNVLTVTGNGKMPIYSSFKKAPWANEKNIDTVKISEGITTVSTDAFSGFSSLKAVYLPNSAETIYGGAFPENGTYTLYGPNNSVGQRLAKNDATVKFAFNKFKILAIGNSHTHDYMNWRDLIFTDLKNAGLKTEIDFDYAIVGGAQLYYKDIGYVGVDGEYRSHYTQGSNKNRPYYNVYSLLRDKNYDLVLVQDYRESVMDKYKYSFAQDLKKVMRWIRNEQPNADVAWVADWTDMNSTGARERLLNQWADNSVNVMKNVDALTDDKPDFVVPMSTALQNARSSYLGSVYNAPDCYGDNSNTDWNGTNGIDKFTILERDGTHCSYELGRYIVSTAVFGKVFDVYKPYMEGLDFDFFAALKTTPEYVTNSIYPWNGEMTKNHMEIAAESAKNAISNPLVMTQSKFIKDPADTIAENIEKLAYQTFTAEGIANAVNNANLGVTVAVKDISINDDKESAQVTFLHGYTKKTVTVNK